MALQKQNIPIIFGNGVDTKTDEKVVQADKMLELENAVFTKKKTFSTRFGSTQFSKNILGSSDTISNPKKLLTFQDELLLATNNKLYSYISSSDAWADRGFIPAVSISSKTVVRNTNAQSVPDGNTLKGVSVYAWEESGGVKASVIDDNSGLPIIADIVISATGVKPKVFVNKTYLLVYYIEGSNWIVRKLNPLNPSSFDTGVTVASDIENNFDLHPHGNNLVYCYNTSGGLVNLGYIKTDGTIGGPIDGFPTDVDTASPGDYAVCIVSRFEGDFNDRIYVTYANAADGVRAAVYDLSLGLIDDNVLDAVGVEVKNITSILVSDTENKAYYELTAATSYNRYVKSNTVDADGVVGTPVTSVKSLGLIAKAFLGSDDNYYVVCAYESSLQSTFFIMRETFSTEQLQVASVVAKYEAGGLTNKNSSLSNVAGFKFPNLIKTELQSVDGDVFSLEGVQATSISFEDKKLYLHKELGKNLHIGGGVLYDYDGRTAVEHGFHFFPEQVSNVASGGGSIEAGTRQYVFVYEWTDNQGQIHRSAPSIPISITNAAGATNTLTVPTLRVTRKCEQSGRSDIRIVGYRTLAAQTTFYRFTSQTSTYFNDITVDSISVVDAAADTSVDGNDVLYTTGGVLENYSPGSCILVEEYRNRLIVAGLEDSNLVRYSKEHVINDSVDFAEEFSFRADGGQGGIKAIARLDEKLLIFKPSEIYYQIGQGPTSTGADDDYQQPIFITTDVGTDEPQSIISMPLGIMFKSNKGYYLLSRSLEPIYLGEPVEAYNNLNVTGAVLLDQYNEVRFSHSNGLTLVYDYIENQWSTFTNKESISSALWQGEWAILKSDGSVFYENPETFFDGQVPVTKKITTAWIQAANIQGAQRIYRVLLIGKLNSRHRLKIDVAYDFDPSVRETFLYNTEQILGSSYYGEGYYGEESYYGGADPVYQVEIRPSIQKCQAIRFTIQDLNDLDIDGAGFELTAMTIQVGIKQGLYRPAMTKRVGPS